MSLIALLACAPTSPPPAAAPTASSPTAPPATTGTTLSQPVLEPWPATDACGGDPDCANLEDVGVVFASNGSGIRFLDLSGDGVVDLGTQDGAFPLPDLGAPLPAAFAWWRPGGAWGVVDYDGDGNADLCAGSGVVPGPLAGEVALDPRWPTDDWGCPEQDLTGDGVSDWPVWDPDAGTLEIHSGPLADSGAVPPWLSIRFEGGSDPAVADCYFDYGFFHDTNSFALFRADVLADPGDELVIADDYYWDPSGAFQCLLAEPLVVPAGIAAEQTVSADGSGELLRIGEAPYGVPDVDGDGHPDALLGTTLVAAPGEAQSGQLAFPNVLGDFSAGGGLLLPDLDGDGLADLLGDPYQAGDAWSIEAGDGHGGTTGTLVRLGVENFSSYGYNPAADVLWIEMSDHLALIRLDDLRARISGG